MNTAEYENRPVEKKAFHVRARRRMLTLLLSAAAIASLALPSFAVSASPPAVPDCTLTITKGGADVMALDSTAWTAGQSGELLKAGMKVRTAEKSQAVLTFFDGSQSVLDASTELEIKELDHEGTAKHIVLVQCLGRTWNHVVKLIDANSPFGLRHSARDDIPRGGGRTGRYHRTDRTGPGGRKGEEPGS